MIRETVLGRRSTSALVRTPSSEEGTTEMFQGHRSESQDQNLVLTVLDRPSSLDSGADGDTVVPNLQLSLQGVDQKATKQVRPVKGVSC